MKHRHVGLLMVYTGDLIQFSNTNFFLNFCVSFLGLLRCLKASFCVVREGAFCESS